MNKLIASIFLLLFIFLSHHVRAQRFGPESKTPRSSVYSINKKYTTVGVSLNALNYFGDLAPTDHILSTNMSLTRLGFGLFGMRRMGPRFSTRVSFNWGRLKGDDYKSAEPAGELSRFRYVRNLQFRNDIKELSASTLR